MKRILFLLMFFSLKTSAQLNVALLHQLISESKSEYAQQDELKSKQLTTSLNAQTNASSLSKLKTRYAKITSRFSSISLALQALEVALESSPIIEELYNCEKQLIDLSTSHPQLIPIVADLQVSLFFKMDSLISYLYALAISSGLLNQMKSSDRKILFEEILVQLRGLRSACQGTLITAKASLRKVRGGVFSDMTNRDRQTAEGIIKKIKNF